VRAALLVPPPHRLPRAPRQATVEISGAFEPGFELSGRALLSTLTT
jgi:hypothetical protein